MEQFVKIGNELVKDCAAAGDPALLGAYGVLAYYLQMPQAPFGGIRNAMYGSASDGVHTVGKVLAELREKGMLRRVRTYNGERFSDLYCLRPKNGKAWPEMTENCVETPKTDFLRAPVSLLRDDRISFAAKGLYLMILRLNEMREIGVPIHLTKLRIRQSAHLHEQAFDRLWNMLKNAGYLSLKRRWNPEFHVTDCEITLRVTAEKAKRAAQPVSDGKPASAIHSDAADASRTIRPAAEKMQNHTYTMHENATQTGEQAAGEPPAECAFECVDRVTDATVPEQNLLRAVLRELFGRAPEEAVTVGGQTVSAEEVRKTVARFTAEDCAEVLARYRKARQNTEIRHPRNYLRACVCGYLTEIYRAKPSPEKPSEACASVADREQKLRGGLSCEPSYSLEEFAKELALEL